jgi:trehalose 6-phosphate synthase
MPLAERRKRHARLLASVRENDVQRWREDFVTALEGKASNKAGATKHNEAA